MSGSWDIATATSLGTGVAKTQINGGNNLTKPTQAVNLVETVPYTVSSGAYTAGESIALCYDDCCTIQGTGANDEWSLLETVTGISNFVDN